MNGGTMKKKNNIVYPTPVETLTHKDRRVNIPTEELRDFVADQEAKPKTILYPRDPSLDPQLVWKGKDEQDREDLTVPAVPIYIQEKIHPKAIIENVRSEAKKGKQDGQMALFGDFNGIGFEELIDFYHHDQNWSNRMILGDSLLVMTSLAEKEGLKGKVQMIYIDPPYGIKFGSNWQVSTRKRDVKDGKADDVTRQPEQIKAFRDTWKLGVSSYLSYLRDRLVVARELLTETGSVFVQIGDENVHLVRCVLDEVFGSDNFVAEVRFATTSGRSADFLDVVSDHLIWYARNREQAKYRNLWQPRPLHTLSEQYTMLELPTGELRRATSEEITTPAIIPSGTRRFMPGDLSSSGASETGSKPFEFVGTFYQLPPNTHWKTHEQGLCTLANANRLIPIGQRLRYRRYEDDFSVAPYTEIWSDTVISGYSDAKIYVVQTSSKVIERCLLMTTDPGDLVLDITCGSGTTSYMAEQWGRRWITCDTSRVALALARTRLMSGKFPYYLLADSSEGVQKEAELTGKMPPDYKTESDIKKGFVYKRVPHITLKSIANNPDIKPGMTREEIDRAISKHADTETLYDQPYEDNKRIRVTGPFTIESLSPHRVAASDEELPESVRNGKRSSGVGQFETMILDNLKKAGVQNRIKNERLKFDRLEPYAGTWLHGEGEYADAEGKAHRVAVSIGPEHGTVGPDQVKEAAKEAVQGVGFEILVVCGFAFDPHVSEEAKRYGKLTILITRMNPDLAMGDELLKKTGAGNLFMVFGEPDVEIKKQKNGKLIVEIKGVDVYDPTTGEIRNSSTDDIACWFIDTEYNGESFFVRHAYFTGAEEPYEKLKRALRADIDESAWSALYSTVSRPFDAPSTRKIAIKVINHYGDEVLKVYQV
jgi:adenine-specific DNA-methyltransferase